MSLMPAVRGLLLPSCASCKQHLEEKLGLLRCLVACLGSSGSFCCSEPGDCDLHDRLVVNTIYGGVRIRMRAS